MKIKFIVLACSYKHGGRCVAGIDLQNKRLIRLVSRDGATNYAIPKEECYLNNRSLVPLDVIEVELVEKAPRNGAQTENYVVSSPLIKSFIGKAKEEDIKPYKFKSEKSPYPFDSKDEFLNHGAYYYKDYSLCLVPAYSIILENVKNAEGNDKTKASFDIYKYNKEKIRLTNYAVTDPSFMLFDGRNKIERTVIGKAWLLISLGQDDDSDNYYKYVSGIIDVSSQLDPLTGLYIFK